jgi:hypothetical protein
MNLGELITALEAADPDLVLPHGFTNPHSYRGHYIELAFEPAYNVTVADMLADARSAVGTTYTGWNGSEFTMDKYSDCYLSEEGCASGEEICTWMLRAMLADGVKPSADPAPMTDAERVEGFIDGLLGLTKAFGVNLRAEGMAAEYLENREGRILATDVMYESDLQSYTYDLASGEKYRRG